MAKLPRDMTPAEINKRLDILDKKDSKLTDQFIADGRGYERPSDRRHLTDPLTLAERALSDERATLRHEIERRYGPGAPSRMPKGFRAISTT